MRTSIIAMLHRRHVAIKKLDQAAEAFWWPGMTGKFDRSRRTVQVADVQES